MQHSTDGRMGPAKIKRSASGRDLRRQGSNKSLRNDVDLRTDGVLGNSVTGQPVLVRQLSNVTKTTLELGTDKSSDTKLTESALRKHETAMAKLGNGRGSTHHVLLHNADCHDADRVAVHSHGCWLLVKAQVLITYGLPCAASDELISMAPHSLQPPLSDLDAASAKDDELRSEDYKAISGRYSRTGTITRGNSAKSLINKSATGQRSGDVSADASHKDRRLVRQGSRKSQMSGASGGTRGSGAERKSPGSSDLPEQSRGKTTNKRDVTPPPLTTQGTQLWSWA